MFQAEDWTLLQSAGVFCACAVVIAIFGIKITRVVDQLADRTGIGEAVAGALLLGASTSLSGVVLSVTAAWKGHPELAVGNALGGIAVQTLFLVVADFAYRPANLEHAAASEPNLMQNALLISLLALILFATSLPEISFWNVHPVTPLMLALYIYGMRLVRGARESPMWRPARTRETRDDIPEEENRRLPLPGLFTRFLLLMAILGFSGWLLEPAATGIARHTGLSETAVGVLFTSVSTSIPELVTSVAAVRMGALTLAVGGIIGGNAYDTLFTAAADIAYRDGSIYHAVPEATLLWLHLTLLMSALLMLGLVRRQKQGVAGVGMEGAAISILYLAGIVLLFLMR